VIIVDEKLIIDNKFFKDNYLKLSIGKKRHIKVELD
jgi:tyrosyl-tRNA synthetase